MYTQHGPDVRKINSAIWFHSLDVHEQDTTPDLTEGQDVVTANEIFQVFQMSKKCRPCQFTVTYSCHCFALREHQNPARPVNQEQENNADRRLRGHVFSKHSSHMLNERTCELHQRWWKRATAAERVDWSWAVSRKRAQLYGSQDRKPFGSPRCV